MSIPDNEKQSIVELMEAIPKHLVGDLADAISRLIEQVHAPRIGGIMAVMLFLESISRDSDQNPHLYHNKQRDYWEELYGIVSVYYENMSYEKFRSHFLTEDVDVESVQNKLMDLLKNGVKDPDPSDDGGILN